MNTKALALICFITSIVGWAKSPVPSTRVVTLVPSLAQIVTEISEASPNKQKVAIVGVSEYSDRPPNIVNGLKEGAIKSVGPYFKPNLEVILSLRPDVVLASKDGSPRVLTEQLETQKVRVTLVNGERLEDIPDSYRKVGAAIGLKDQGVTLADNFSRDWKSFLEKSQKSQCRARVILVFFDASGSSLIVVGANTFLGDLLLGAGFENAYAASGLKDRYPRVAKEDLLNRPSDLLMVLGTETDTDKALTQFVEQLGWKKKWLALRNTELQRPTRGVLVPLAALREDACTRIGKKP